MRTPPLSLRNIVWAVAVVVFLPTLWVTVFNGGDLVPGELMDQRLSELRARLQYAESLNQDRESDIQTLRQQINVLMTAHKHNNLSLGALQLQKSTTCKMPAAPQALRANGSESYQFPQETRELLANLTVSSSDMSPPGMFHYMPHLIGKPEGLRPAFKLSQGRAGVSVVVAIPHIKRNKESYLQQTLDSLIASLNDVEKQDCLLVLFIAEPWDQEYVRTVAKEVQARYKDALALGLLEVVAPPALFYPDLNNLKETFGDPMERVKWRTKQNLDYSFLMMYSKSRATYYVQLEDDVITKPGYLSTMKNFAVNQKTDDWMLLEFSHLGFIGKMFKSSDIPMVVEFFLMFFRDKPIDWLLDHLLANKVCNPEKDAKHCWRSMAEVRRRFKPSLFQHIGTHSSLTGKVQKLKDKDFGKGSLVKSHINPNAEVSTTLKTYQRHSIDRAYLGETFFWGTFPKASDFIMFKFVPAITLEKYLFRSGNAEHPGDKFFNTTIEVLPLEHIGKQGGMLNNAEHTHSFPRTPDSFLVIGSFNHITGVAEGDKLQSLGEIDTLRLRVQTDSESWVILSEVLIKQQQGAR